MTAAPARLGAPTGLGWRDYGTDFVKVLSLVNLMHLRIWSELLTYSRSDLHYSKHPPTPAHYYAILADVAGMSILAWCGIALSRRVQGRKTFGLAQFAFVLALLALANAVREVLSGRNIYLRGQLFRAVGTSGVIAIVVGGLAIVAVLLWKWGPRILAGASGLLLIFSPFVLVTFSGAAQKIARYTPSAGAHRPAAAFQPPGARTTDQRIVWIVFDELDYRLSFVDRRPGLELPAFDRLQNETLHASNAFPPSGSTTLSLPSYITGELVEGYEPTGPAQASMTIAGKAGRVTWANMPTVFGKARAMGFNTALAGWYLPYCRVLDNLNRCWWTDMELQANSLGERFGELMINQPRSLVETNLFSPFSGSLGTEMRIRNYGELRDHAVEAATDERIGLTLLHLQPPHSPHVYDRSTGQFGGERSPITGYLDSLALADRALADLRAAMESSGLWDSTTVLVTSDHWYRTAVRLDGKFDRRVPFLLKLRGQHEGTPYTRAFATLKTSELLLGILGGQIRTTGDVERWLDGHPYGGWEEQSRTAGNGPAHF